MKRARVLVVDDKDSYLALFRRIAPADIEIVCASDSMRALKLLTSDRFDVVVSDIRMPGIDGMALLKRIRDIGVDVDVILMTAYGTIAEAVRAMKYGAADYLTKPFETDEALAALEHTLARRRARANARTPAGAPMVLGKSATMNRVRQLIERASESDVTVLLTGECGTGKELVARAIHAKSSRASKCFVAVNCGALPEALVQSEPVGDLKEAVTGPRATKLGFFEEASGGTLFLDEVGELPLAVQVELTRALQESAGSKVGGTDERSISVRVIAATNVDLPRAVEDGRFRQDLFYRLNVLVIALPPLRERREDIPLLTTALLDRIAVPSGRPRHLSEEALACLASYDWPGNVRQLENALARAAAISMAEEIGIDALPSEVRGADAAPKAHRTLPLTSLSYREAIAVERERATREYLAALLRDAQGNVTQAAERAGIERESFHRLMKRHGVRAEDYRAK